MVNFSNFPQYFTPTPQNENFNYSDMFRRGENILK